MRLLTSRHIIFSFTPTAGSESEIEMGEEGRGIGKNRRREGNKGGRFILVGGGKKKEATLLPNRMKNIQCWV